MTGKKAPARRASSRSDLTTTLRVGALFSVAGLGAGERRTAWLFLSLVAAQLLLLAAQAPADRSAAGGPERAAPSLLEAMLVSLTAPLGRLSTGAVELFDVGRHGWGRYHRLVAENRRLESEVESLRQEAVRLRGVEEEARRLAAVVDQAQPGRELLQVADVVYLDRSSWQRTLIVHAGGVEPRPDQPVVTTDGLVGRVIVASGSYARVQLITDTAAGVGAKIERTRRQGVVRGAGGGALELQYVSRQADARPGDRVVTAGNDGIYPKGFPIGTVVEVERGDELFHRIRLTPAVDFSRLDHVYLLSPQTLPEEVRLPPDGARR